MKRRWVQFFLCLLLSAGIWFFHNLSQNYLRIVSVSFIAESNLGGYATRSSSEATVSAQINASGHLLWSLNRHRKNVRVIYIEPSDLQQLDDNTFSISNSVLLKYSKYLFGEGANVESFISESTLFTFAKIYHKKVPVRKNCSLSYSSQYMPVSSLRISPDSVFVYGESAHLENIDYINTKPLNLSNISSSVHGVIKLDVPNRKLRLSDSEVIYSLEVSRYVELVNEYTIYAKNEPIAKKLTILPSKVTLTLRTPFPSNNTSLDNIKVYVDYNEFLDSINGICIPKIEGLPAGVLDYDIEPDVVTCISVQQ